VLACADYPLCNGRWWPEMDFAAGFTVLRELGQAGSGALLPFEALVAIHMVHRWFAVIVLVALLVLGHRLWHRGAGSVRRFGLALAGLALVQVASGLGNVLLGWPLLAALLHTAGAAALVLVLVLLLVRGSRPAAAGAAAGALAAS
jgi:cytochrome c oxidase assembly protein subunit 15